MSEHQRWFHRRSQECGCGRTPRELLRKAFDESKVALREDTNDDPSAAALGRFGKKSVGVDFRKLVEPRFLCLPRSASLFLDFANLLWNIPNVTRKELSRLQQSCVVTPRRPDRTLATDELHSPALAYFLDFAQQNAADLSCGMHVGAATSSKVEVADVYQA